MNAIDVQDLLVNNNGFILKDITLSVPQGSVVSLIGRNGAGKTTLMKSILNGYKKQKGSISFWNLSSQKDGDTILHDIAWIGDEFMLRIEMKLNKIIKQYAAIYPRFDETLFNSYCEEIDIDLNKPMVNLSLGQKKLIEIYFALARKPKLLILDEPMANLDPIIRRKMIELLHQFMIDEEHSILISSHILSDLEKLSDYVAFMEKGELKLLDRIDNLYENYYEVHLPIEKLDEYQKYLFSFHKHEYEIQGICTKEHIANIPLLYQKGHMDMETMLYLLSGEEITC